MAPRTMLGLCAAAKQAGSLTSGTARIAVTTNFYQTAGYKIATKSAKVMDVYEPTPRLIPKGSSPILEVKKQLYQKYDPDGKKRALFDPNSPTYIQPGDVVRVTKSDKSSFIGMLIAINQRDLATNILLRTKITGVGVEQRYNVFNPFISQVELLRVPRKRWASDKLYFIRENSKLDVGDVDSEIRKTERKRL